MSFTTAKPKNSYLKRSVTDEGENMDSGFINILNQLVKEQGKNALFDLRQSKALLTDYTKNEYKKEKRLLLQGIEVGAAKALAETDDIEPCKKST